MDTDHQAALELSRQINSNPGRSHKSSHDPSSQTQTFHRKIPASGSLAKSKTDANQVTNDPGPLARTSGPNPRVTRSSAKRVEVHNNTSVTGAPALLARTSVPNPRVTRSSAKRAEVHNNISLERVLDAPVQTSIVGSTALPLTAPSTADYLSGISIPISPDSGPVVCISTTITPPEVANNFEVTTSLDPSAASTHVPTPIFDTANFASTFRSPRVVTTPELNKNPDDIISIDIELNSNHGYAQASTTWNFDPIVRSPTGASLPVTLSHTQTTTSSEMQSTRAFQKSWSSPSRIPQSAAAFPLLHTFTLFAPLSSPLGESSRGSPTSLEAITPGSDDPNSVLVDSNVTNPPATSTKRFKMLPASTAANDIEMDSTDESATIAAQYLYTAAVSAADSAPVASPVLFTSTATVPTSLVKAVDETRMTPLLSSESLLSHSAQPSESIQPSDFYQPEVTFNYSMLPPSSDVLLWSDITTNANIITKSGLTQHGNVNSASTPSASLDLLADAAVAEVSKGYIEGHESHTTAKGPIESDMQDVAIVSNASSPLSSPPLSPTQNNEFDEMSVANDVQVHLSTPFVTVLDLNAEMNPPSTLHKRVHEEAPERNTKRIKLVIKNVETAKLDVVKLDITQDTDAGKLDAAKPDFTETIDATKLDAVQPDFMETIDAPNLDAVQPDFIETMNAARLDAVKPDSMESNNSAKLNVVELDIIENIEVAKFDARKLDIENINLAKLDAAVELDTEDLDTTHIDITPHQEPSIKMPRSKQHYNVNEQLDKPSPIGLPLVWADKRQQLCETLPYYRAYQSGAYCHDGIVRGFLINKEVEIRDVFNHHIVITTAGGGRSVDDTTGERGRKKDQGRSATVNALIKAKEHRLAVAVIAGQGNRLCPSQLPHYYNVLDWFHVTDVWCEKNGGLNVWMVRLEKIDLSAPSWWQDALSSHPHSDYLQPKAPKAICNTCQVSSKQIYTCGWVCLNSDCNSFFRIGGVVLTDEDLQYTAEYISERTIFAGSSPGSLAPPILTDDDVQNDDLFGIEERCKKGIVCPKCGCCSRRIEWTHWSCENKDCDFIHSVTQRPVPIESALSHARGFKSKKKAPRKLIHNGLVLSQKEVIGKYEVVRYDVPGEQGESIGQILHLKATYIINQQPGGPDELFRDMQGQDFGLRRNPARQKDRPGEILTSHWAINFGAPYKFGVATISHPFSEAKPVIVKTVKRLTWAGHQALSGSGEIFQDFNELLALGYFEDTEIGYHDDGEKELGPTVASLSLGASASMSWRPKSKSAIGNSAGKKNLRGTKKPFLQITLKHGDIMVMHGPKIQQHYEHAVTPHGKLRFALTCRHIRPEMMATDEDREYTITAGTLPAWANDYEYDGDVKQDLDGDVDTEMVDASA